MKNKIILLLVLLLPSLCFGESLSISINTDLDRKIPITRDLDRKIQNIAITSSKYKNKKIFILKLSLSSIKVSQNRKEWNEIEQYLIKLGLGRLKTMGKDVIHALDIETYIENNAVWNNWQVTEIYLDKTIRYWKIYLYRPDN